MKDDKITKRIDKIYFCSDSKVFNDSKNEVSTKVFNSILNNLNNEIAKIIMEDYIRDINHNVIYIPSLNAVIPDPEHFKFALQNVGEFFSMPKSVFMNFSGFKGKVMGTSQVRQIFFQKDHIWLSKLAQVFTKNIPEMSGFVFRGYKYEWFDFSSGEERREFGSGIRSKNGSVPKALICPIADCGTAGFLGIVISNDFIPENLSKKSREFLECLVMNSDKVGIDKGKITAKSGLMSQIKKNFPNMLSGKQDDESVSNIINHFLECDERRVDLERYDERILTDINRGHWGLWDNGSSAGEEYIELKNPVVARNPLADIKKNGIIGIDFGTKSTVVVCKDGSAKPIPMRIGLGKLNKEAKPKHYENPTILEFINLKSFLKDYSASMGRPETKWEDITVSHSAMQEMLEDVGNSFNSYFSALKQWCSEKDYYVKITDKKSNDYQLDPYTSDDNIFDPIEIYAYYLGLYINNMYNGIYLDYLMSFPVSFEKSLRDKLIQSFSNGLKKSLPQTVLDDEDTMERFSVRMGASEPAAYAVCALRQYELEPDSEPIFYGVFDFGGGTTDFDFGLWSFADDSDLRYDYIIEHFGAGGDAFLGGENILRVLAYNVFVDNLEFCRSSKITFQRPPECERFAGDEIFVRNSQESGMNMNRCMEALRPIWERREELYSEIRDRGEISVQLYDVSGKTLPGCSLTVDCEKLEQMISDRIHDGINRFFHALKTTFKSNNRLKSINTVNIFLAGNSCLSPIVTELFEKEIEDHTSDIDSSKTFFNLYPPLGCDEAFEILGRDNHSDIMLPTGKTGVAFGLIDSRPGGRIKVISGDTTEPGETKFRYYIGISRRDKFYPLIEPCEEYGKWHKFLPADEYMEIYFTTLPDASTNKLDISETDVRRLRLPVTDENAYVYICASGPHEITYTAALESDIGSGNYLFDAIKENLNS